MATSKIYVLPETAIWFTPATATNNDYDLGVHSLGAGAGRQSARHDFGVSARARRFTWRAFCQFATTPVLDETVDIYYKGSDGAHPDNDDGTGDAAVSSINKLKNLPYLGSILVDEAAANIEMVQSGEIELSHRYVQFVFWNATADGLTSDVNENGLLLIPVPDQGQAT